MILNQFGFTKGANTNINPLLNTQPTVMSGCTNTWKVGALTADTGYASTGTGLESGKNVLGLYNFIQAPGTEKMLCTMDDATSDDTQLFYSTGGNWTEVTAAEAAWANHAGIDVEMESFIGYCFFVGYGATDGFIPSCSLTGTTFSTSTNVTSMPEGKYVKRYRDRIYVANCNIGSTTYPYRVYYSSVPSAGAITWTVASDFIDVDFSDQITGIVANWDKLLIYTQYSTYSYDQTSWKKVWDHGAVPKTIQTSGAYTIWANSNGVLLSTGGQPQNISGEVIDLIRNSTQSYWRSALVDEEYHLYLGATSANGVTYTNCLLTFSIPLSAWRWRELGHAITSLGRYNSSGVQSLWMGASGLVYKKGKYTDTTLLSSDATLPIRSNFELPMIHLKDISKLKRINELVAIAERAQGLKLFYRFVDERDRILTEYKPLGTLTKYINSLKPEISDGVFLQICGSSYSTNPYWTFLGYSLDIDITTK